MSSETILAIIAAVSAVAGVGVLRLAWAQPRRSTLYNGIGWGLLLVATLSSAFANGAWGISVAWLYAMGAALLLLGHAAITSPGAKVRASTRRANILPGPGEKKHLMRRINTFLLVGVAAMLVSFALAIAVRGLCTLLGASEANSNAVAIFATPLVWGVLAYLILMQERRRSQGLILAVSALPALPALWGLIA